VPETFESIAILADNSCTGVKDTHAENIAEMPPLD